VASKEGFSVKRVNRPSLFVAIAAHASAGGAQTLSTVLMVLGRYAVIPMMRGDKMQIDN